MIVLHILFALSFIMSIVVQLNDTDGWIWIVIYIIPLIFSIQAMRKKYYPFSIAIGLGFLLAAAILLPWSHASEFSQYVSEYEMTSLESERTREALGLAICAVYFLITGFLWFKGEKSPTSEAPASTEAD